MTGLSMSFTPTHRTIPRVSRETVPRDMPRERVVAAFLRGIKRCGHSIKHASRLIGRAPRTCLNWTERDSAPDLESLANLCRLYDEVWDEWRAICGRENDKSDAEHRLEMFRQLLDQKRGVTNGKGSLSPPP